MMSEEHRIPRHVAIIMDGNGRWAELHGMERYEGHTHGIEPIRIVLRTAARLGVQYLTLYAFSTENWGRPANEVRALMELFCRCAINEMPELKAQGVRVRVIGDRSHFSDEVRHRLEELEDGTRNGTRLTLVLAIDYSSRLEIVEAARELARKAAAGALDPEAIDEQHFADALWTAGMPDPDLVIRTSGEQRLSNFLLWQASYAELYFPEVLWPDFGEKEFVRALEAYAQRDRRFGLVKTTTHNVD